MEKATGHAVPKMPPPIHKKTSPKRGNHHKLTKDTSYHDKSLERIDEEDLDALNKNLHEVDHGANISLQIGTHNYSRLILGGPNSLLTSVSGGDLASVNETPPNDYGYSFKNGQDIIKRNATGQLSKVSSKE